MWPGLWFKKNRHSLFVGTLFGIISLKATKSSFKKYHRNGSLIQYKDTISWYLYLPNLYLLISTSQIHFMFFYLYSLVVAIISVYFVYMSVHILYAHICVKIYRKENTNTFYILYFMYIKYMYVCLKPQISDLFKNPWFIIVANGISMTNQLWKIC